MLEAVTESRVDGLPWQVQGNGLGIADAEGKSLYMGNIWIGPDSLDERLVLTKQRAALVCQAVNMHAELINRLAELIALTSAVYLELANLDTGIADTLARSNWASVIERAVATMEKTKGAS